MCVCTHIQTLAHVCTYIRIHPGTYIDIYFFFFAYLYIHVQHIHAYRYIHMHVYTHHRFFFDFFSSSEILRCFPHTVLFFFHFDMKTPERAYTSPVKRIFNNFPLCFIILTFVSGTLIQHTNIILSVLSWQSFGNGFCL